MRYLYFVFLFAVSSCSLFAQEETSHLRDILTFRIDSVTRKIYKWNAMPFSQKGQRSKIEDVVLKDGRNVKVLTFPKVNKPSELRMSAGFLMPHTENFHDMEVLFTCKKQGVDALRLIFLGFNTSGDMISVDTLNVVETSDWVKSAKTIHIKDVSYMRLVLEMYSSSKNISRILEIDKIELKVAGKDLAEYPPCDIIGKNSIEMKNISQLSFSNPSFYQQIPQLHTKKFVALGESLHGSGTLSEVAIQIMKYRILYENCTLILLESPFEKMLSVNRFVHGDSRFDLDAIANAFGLGLYSEKLLDFVMWVKEYNHTAKRKVSLLGMDIPSPNFWICSTDQYDYFYRLNKNSMNDSIKTFLRMILADTRNAMTNRLPLIKNDIDFKKNSDSLEIRMIEHSWNDWLKVTDDEKMYDIRDSLMYSNVKFMSELLCNASETVTLHSHLLHASYNKMPSITNYPRVSYGAFLKKEFRNDYCVIGLFTYQGEVLLIPKMETINKSEGFNFAVKRLQAVYGNSLENLLHKVGTEYFFVPVSLLPDTQLYFRLGVNNGQYVSIIHPAHCMDGVIYAKKSEAMHVVHENRTMQMKYKDVMQRFDRYQRGLEDR